MGATVAAKNRKVRQESLRELLSNKGLVEKVTDIAKKLEDQHLKLEPSQANALKASAEIRMKLINKYLPDLKQSDITVGGDEDNPLNHKIEIEFVAPPNS